MDYKLYSKFTTTLTSLGAQLSELSDTCPGPFQNGHGRSRCSKGRRFLRYSKETYVVLICIVIVMSILSNHFRWTFSRKQLDITIHDDTWTCNNMYVYIYIYIYRYTMIMRHTWHDDILVKKTWYFMVYSFMANTRIHLQAYGSLPGPLKSASKGGSIELWPWRETCELENHRPLGR